MPGKSISFYQGYLYLAELFFRAELRFRLQKSRSKISGKDFTLYNSCTIYFMTAKLITTFNKHKLFILNCYKRREELLINRLVWKPSVCRVLDLRVLTGIYEKLHIPFAQEI